MTMSRIPEISRPSKEPINVGMGFDMTPFLSTPIFYVRWWFIVQFVKDRHERCKRLWDKPASKLCKTCLVCLFRTLSKNWRHAAEVTSRQRNRVVVAAVMVLFVAVCWIYVWWFWSAHIVWKLQDIYDNLNECKTHLNNQGDSRRQCHGWSRGCWRDV